MLLRVHIRAHVHYYTRHISAKKGLKMKLYKGYSAKVVNS